jgi:hypothetical protein
VASELKESDLKQRLFIASKTVRPTQKWVDIRSIFHTSLQLLLEISFAAANRPYILLFRLRNTHYWCLVVIKAEMHRHIVVKSEIANLMKFRYGVDELLVHMPTDRHAEAKIHDFATFTCEFIIKKPKWCDLVLDQATFSSRCHGLTSSEILHNTTCTTEFCVERLLPIRIPFH